MSAECENCGQRWTAEGECDTQAGRIAELTNELLAADNAWHDKVVGLDARIATLETRAEVSQSERDNWADTLSHMSARIATLTALLRFVCEETDEDAHQWPQHIRDRIDAALGEKP